MTNQSASVGRWAAVRGLTALPSRVVGDEVTSLKYFRWRRISQRLLTSSPTDFLETKRMNDGTWPFRVFRMFRGQIGLFPPFFTLHPSAWTASTRADAISPSADGKSTCASIIGRRAGSPSTGAFGVGTRAFASSHRAHGGFYALLADFILRFRRFSPI